MRKNIFRLLPEKIRAEYSRNALNIEELGPEYEFIIATTKEELEAAYKLLALPFANVIIAKHLNQVVGTVTVIKDSVVGFPSDKDYKKENDHYRLRGFNLCEISALGVAPEYRKKKSGGFF